MVIRVAVIGAGAAGLCALRHLTSYPNQFEAVAFERLSDEGGAWHYTDKFGADENGVPVQSSMYKNLRVNIPKEIMAFPDYPFPENLPSFLHHTDVLKYIKGYCKHFQLYNFIKFETKVDRVEPVPTDTDKDGPLGSWAVSYSNVVDPSRSWTEVFDAVMVCNGHFTVPRIPEVRGLDDFQGLSMHSSEYRSPEIFTDQTVVCLGAGFSGKDISLDLAPVAKKVIISHNKPEFFTNLPNNICQQPGIDHVTQDSVVFRNGRQEPIDAIVLCTGYRYSFPFLTDQCMINTEDERVTPLYKHLIHTKYPSLSFIGICKYICPYPLFDCQVKFVLSVLNGSHKLPTTDVMTRDTEMDFQERLREGIPQRHAHTMGSRLWGYMDTLAEQGGFEPTPPVVRSLFDAVDRERDADLLNYKAKEYQITGEESYEEVERR